MSAGAGATGGRRLARLRGAALVLGIALFAAASGIVSCGDDVITTPSTILNASFTVMPRIGTTSTDFLFDASGSSDPQDPVSALQVRWDWEGDGTWDTDYSTDKTTTRRYDSLRVWVVILEVMDTDGLTDTTARSITVTESLLCEASWTGPQFAPPFDAAFQAEAGGGTPDPDTSSAPYTFHWVFGDGESSLEQNPSHTYPTAGPYASILAVRDAGGQTCRDTVLVEFLAPLPPLPPPGRTTPESLLTSWFQRAYNQQDSILYDQMLLPDFRFQFLPADAETLQAIGILPPGVDYWDKPFDMASTGGMFRTETVGEIALDIVVISDSLYAGGDCVGCREIESTVVLRVTTNPLDPFPIVLAVDSPQTFVVGKDPADTTLWAIFRQFDRSSPGARLSFGMWRYRGADAPIRIERFVNPDRLFEKTAIRPDAERRGRPRR